MPAHAAAVGSELDISNITVTPRRALAYAAAIMDTSTEVFDDARPDGRGGARPVDVRVGAALDDVVHGIKRSDVREAAAARGVHLR